MGKYISIILISVGLGCLIYGGWQIMTVNAKQQQTLDEAWEMIEEARRAQTQERVPEVDETVTDYNPEELVVDVDAGDEEVEEAPPPPPPQPGVGDVIGVLEIPRLDRVLPIVSGTDDDDLDKGVGHYLGTSLPGEDDQILLSGHRDTVFRRMGDMQVGDHFIVHMTYGTFTYELRETKIVDADDRTIIGSTAPVEELVVTTCYPFRYVGRAPDRYIMYAYPVEVEE